MSEDVYFECFSSSIDDNDNRPTVNGIKVGTYEYVSSGSFYIKSASGYAQKGDVVVSQLVSFKAYALKK